jgi:hypothetical protein
MTDLQSIFQAIDDLTPDEVKELYQYIVEHRIEFVRYTRPDQPRVLGLHAHLGKAWMSEDFHDDLFTSTQNQ